MNSARRSEKSQLRLGAQLLFGCGQLDHDFLSSGCVTTIRHRAWPCVTTLTLPGVNLRSQPMKLVHFWRLEPRVPYLAGVEELDRRPLRRGRCVARGRARRGLRPAERRLLLHRPRALPERRPARQGQPRAGLGRRHRDGLEDRPHAQRRGRRHAEDRRHLLRPLRRGTRAVVRQASLSGVANRYVDLQLPPGDDSNTPKIADGGTIPQDSTTTAVDLDQLFNTFDPKTRKSLSGLIQGFAKQSDGASKNINAGFAYLSPSLAASSRLFNELTYDKPALREFLVDSSQLTGDIAQRKEDLAGLVDHLATTTRAIGREDNDLQDAIQELPPFMRRANTTFVNLRATLDDVDPLVAESKPVAKKLRPFLAELRPLARDAAPDAARPLGDHPVARRRQRPDRGHQGQRPAARRRGRPDPAQRQGTPGRPARVGQGAGDEHARDGHRAALRTGSHRLVRRLQPFGHLRRPRWRQPRRALRQRVHERQRHPQAADRRQPPARGPDAAAEAGRSQSIRPGRRGAAPARSSVARPTSPRRASRATSPRGRSGHEARAHHRRRPRRRRRRCRSSPWARARTRRRQARTTPSSTTPSA